MGRRNWNTPSGSAFSSGYTNSTLPSDRSSLNSYVSLEEQPAEDKIGRPLMKRKTCWQRRCPCINCCCPCLPGWSQCLLLTLMILGSFFLITFFSIGPITTALINNGDPKKIELDGLAINFPSLTTINITFNVKLLDPSPLAADVAATTVRLSVQKNGAQTFLANVPIHAFHISPGTNTTVKVPVLEVSLINGAGVEEVLKQALTDGKVTINSKADLTLHIPIWPFPIYCKMDKTMPPVGLSSLGKPL